MEPSTAMPSALPNSREVSLTADATPCLATGVFCTIAVVAGAVHRPRPTAAISNGTATSRYVLPASS